MSQQKEDRMEVLRWPKPSGFSPTLLRFLSHRFLTCEDLRRAPDLYSDLHSRCGELDRSLAELCRQLLDRVGSSASRSSAISGILAGVRDGLAELALCAQPTDREGEVEGDAVFVEELAELAREAARLETVRAYAETTQKLDKLIGDVEDAVSSLSGKMEASSIHYHKELQMVAIRSLKNIEEILSFETVPKNQWTRLVSAVDNRVDRALAVLRPQAIADHRSLLVSLGWPPALSDLTNPEIGKTMESINPLLTMDGDLKDRYYESFHALCNLQEFQMKRKRRQLEGHNLQVALYQPLWAIEELVNPIALASQRYFSNWLDKPEFIFALVYKITRDFVDSMDEILQPLIDKARLVGYSCREEWIAAIMASLNTYLAKEVFPAFVAQLQAEGYVEVPSQTRSSWLSLIDSMMLFDKKIQSLIVSTGSVKEGENLQRVSSLSVFSDRPDWLEVWAALELEDALDKLKPEMESEKSWKTKIDAALVFSGPELQKTPSVANVVLRSLSFLIDRSRPIPDIALRHKFINLAGLPLLRHFFDVMLRRCQEAEGLTALADDDALSKVCTSINAAEYCEFALTEWSEDVFFIEMVGESEDSFFGVEVKSLQEFARTWIEKIATVILRGFDARCREYTKNKKQWQEKGDGQSLSKSFVESLDHLQGKLSKLQGDMNEVDFTRLWRNLAGSVDQFIFTAILIGDTKFSDRGVVRLGSDLALLHGVFRQWCLRPEGFFPRLNEGMKLLNSTEAFFSSIQKQKWLNDSGLWHLTVAEAEKIARNRVHD